MIALFELFLWLTYTYDIRRQMQIYGAHVKALCPKGKSTAEAKRADANQHQLYAAHASKA